MAELFTPTLKYVSHSESDYFFQTPRKTKNTDSNNLYRINTIASEANILDFLDFGFSTTNSTNYKIPFWLLPKLLTVN